jgi:hypothetical protein
MYWRRLAMPKDKDFAVFVQDERGPLWREDFLDAETAVTKAKQLALDEELEFFVFSFKDYSVVARFLPTPKARSSEAKSRQQMLFDNTESGC